MNEESFPSLWVIIVLKTSEISPKGPAALAFGALEMILMKASIVMSLWM